MSDAPSPDAAAPVYCIAVDANGVVISHVRSNVAQPGMAVVDADTWWRMDALGWRCTFDGTAVAAHTPPAPASPPPTVTGNQWAFALSGLGLSSAWQVGVAKSKASDQVRVSLIARDTPLVAADPLLIRIAANVGIDANGNPLIDVPTVFAAAQGMPT